ncbi:MAG: hypothetical protein LC640_11345 [Frankia sp.]|nr:hypothetical protein [Frankia sp.]
MLLAAIRTSTARPDDLGSPTGRDWSLRFEVLERVYTVSAVKTADGELFTAYVGRVGSGAAENSEPLGQIDGDIDLNSGVIRFRGPLSMFAGPRPGTRMWLREAFTGRAVGTSGASSVVGRELAGRLYNVTSATSDEATGNAEYRAGSPSCLTSR